MAGAVSPNLTQYVAQAVRARGVAVAMALLELVQIRPPAAAVAAAVVAVAGTSPVHLSPAAAGDSAVFRRWLAIAIMPLENLAVVMADKAAAVLILVLAVMGRTLVIKLFFMEFTLRPPMAVAAMAQCLATMVRAQESAPALSL